MQLPATKQEERLLYKKNAMGFWNQIGEYLFLRKKDPGAPQTSWVRYMHGINRISIFLFLIGLIILTVKLFRR